MKHTSTLIQGDFTKDKAKTLLLELLTHKINFHEKQKLSDKERFGEDRERSEKRIQALKAERQSLKHWIDTVEDNATLKIYCDVDIYVIL